MIVASPYLPVDGWVLVGELLSPTRRYPGLPLVFRSAGGEGPMRTVRAYLPASWRPLILATATLRLHAPQETEAASTLAVLVRMVRDHGADSLRAVAALGGQAAVEALWLAHAVRSRPRPGYDALPRP